jgi:CRISPR/Cas system-associated exonuclease Cas4 (RecB family)
MLTSLTQGHLKQLETCPRKFQYGYLDQLLVPTAPAMRESQEWGTRFHQIMQQRELGLSVAPLLDADPELAAAVDRIVEAAPELFHSQDAQLRQSEHRRTTAFGEFVLTVVYDLLLLTPEKAQIIDWKTYPKPKDKKTLQQDWQTRLYLYVLAETADYKPEQLSMSYWFVRAQDPATGELQPTQVEINYSTQKHRQTEHDLQKLTAQLTQLMAEDEPFPKVSLAAGRCDSCPYAMRCQRPSELYPTDLATHLPAIEDIAEVPL